MTGLLLTVFLVLLALGAPRHASGLLSLRSATRTLFGARIVVPTLVVAGTLALLARRYLDVTGYAERTVVSTVGFLALYMLAEGLAPHTARLAGAHEFISELPEGYDTMVGEHGSTLSGGQRQRIAIARALITNPRILIFDEATSALDYESERIIQNNMQAICKGRTVLIIAHRLSAVRMANRIIVMERGQIVEQGSHQELVNKPNGHYAHLFQMQQG